MLFQIIMNKISTAQHLYIPVSLDILEMVTHILNANVTPVSTLKASWVRVYWEIQFREFSAACSHG